MITRPIDVRIDYDPVDPKGTVLEVGGVEVQSVCQGFTMAVDARNRTPRITLDLFVNTATHHGPAFVDVPEKTHAALVAIGWTPPPADEAAPAEEQLLPESIRQELAEMADDTGFITSGRAADRVRDEAS